MVGAKAGGLRSTPFNFFRNYEDDYDNHYNDFLRVQL